MALQPDAVRAAARAVDDAYRTRELLRPFSATHPGMTIEDAYAVQSAWADLRTAGGRRIVGHKIGLTSKAMQSASLVTEPDYGVLLDDTVFDDGVDFPAGAYKAPRVEVELAFVMKREVRGPGCTVFDVLNATDYITPSIEVLDSRVHRVDPETQKPRTIVDNICDNAGNAGLITGGRPFRPDDVDLRWVAALCLRNGQIEETGVAAGVLGHPALSVAWLANKLAGHGVAIQAGQVLLSGSFIRIVPARAGDTLHADFGPLGSVSCHFS